MANEYIDVSDTTPRIAYIATNGQTLFTVPFVFFAGTDLLVYQNGVLRTLATHYTVSGAEDPSGTVTLLTGATVGDEIMIVRELTIEQTTHIPPSGPLDIAAVNVQFSKLVAIDQQLANSLQRSLRLPDNVNVEDGLQTTAPVPGEFLKWNADGNGVESAALVPSGGGGGDFSIATESEAEAGTLNDVLMTPLRVAQSIAERVPGIMAWEHGVPGDGTDQTAALQALIDAIPNYATVWIRGNVVVSAINLSGRQHIVFRANKGSAGSTLDTRFTISAGAIGAGVAAIDCHNTVNVSFHGINFVSNNALFNGILLDYGGTNPLVNGQGAYMQVTDCFFVTVSAGTATALNLYGTTNGRFSECKFQGPGVAIKLQLFASVGFCNNHIFLDCTFQPGALYPISGSGEGITFQSCCFQAGTDGQGRAMQTSGSQQFKGLNFIGCTFYDPLATGDSWIHAQWGSGFTMIGCRVAIFTGTYGVQIGGTANADPQIGGVRGVALLGNFFEGGNGGLFFLGTAAAKSNVRGGLIAGNSVTNGILLGNYSEAENLVLMGNAVYGDLDGVGMLPMFLNLPAYASNAAAVAAGLVAGQLYRVANVVQIVA
jgi:hypothetical protein